MSVRVKICAVTTPDDAAAAVDAGADLIGLNFVPGTPRVLTLREAEAISDRVAGSVERVAVFRDANTHDIDRVLRRVDLERVQLHGSETPEEVDEVDLPTIKALRGVDHEAAEAYPGSLLLLDHPTEEAGSGQAWAWSEAGVLIEEGFDVILAGGLSPENVGEALRSVGDLLPWGVDVASGVEAEKRVKSIEKMRAFVKAVRDAEDAS